MKSVRIFCTFLSVCHLVSPCLSGVTACRVIPSVTESHLRDICLHCSKVVNFLSSSNIIFSSNSCQHAWQTTWRVQMRAEGLLRACFRTEQGLFVTVVSGLVTPPSPYVSLPLSAGIFVCWWHDSAWCDDRARNYGKKGNHGRFYNFSKNSKLCTANHTGDISITLIFCFFSCVWHSLTAFFPLCFLLQCQELQESIQYLSTQLCVDLWFRSVWQIFILFDKFALFFLVWLC